MRSSTSLRTCSQNSSKAANAATGCGSSFRSSKGSATPRNPVSSEFRRWQKPAAYLQHPVLGLRLIECTQLVNAVEGSSAENIFGEIDAMKFRSSMTLFAKAATDNQIFIAAIDKYFAGEFDDLTINRLAGELPANARRK